MPRGPIGEFGWLLNCCINDDAGSTSLGLAVSAVVLFSSGILASGFTAYLAGIMHVL